MKRKKSKVPSKKSIWSNQDQRTSPWGLALGYNDQEQPPRQPGTRYSGKPCSDPLPAFPKSYHIKPQEYAERLRYESGRQVAPWDPLPIV